LALPGYAQKDKWNEKSARIQRNSKQRIAFFVMIHNSCSSVYCYDVTEIADHQRIRFGTRTFMKVGRTSIRQQIGIPKKKKTV
jgi:hypothetical protein